MIRLSRLRRTAPFRLALFVAVNGLLAAGCQTASRSAPPPGYRYGDLRDLKTRRDVIEKFGLPNRVGDEGDSIVYTYIAARQKGLSAGGGAYGVTLQIAHGHRIEDRLVVHLDKQGQVEKITPLIWSDQLGYRWWAFGD